MQKIKLKKEPSLVMKYSTLDYQQAAIDFAKDREFCGIFHEQGLGKTVIGINIASYWLKNEMVDTVLFLTKKSLIQNWVDEFQKHSHLKPKVLSNKLGNNKNILNSPCRIVLANFEVMSSQKNIVKLLLESRSIAIIIDESAKIKNPETSISQALHELSPLFKRRIIMTGTPIANRPYDIWSQIFFLDQGNALGTNFDDFKRQYDLTNDMHDDHGAQETFRDSLEILFQNLESFCIRETKKSSKIDLPEKFFHEIICQWEPVQYSKYLGVKNETRIFIQRNREIIEDDSESILKRLLRLIQVASNPGLIDESYTIEPGKYIELIDIIDDIISKGEKCIIWTSFIDNVDWLAKKLKNFGCVKVHGKMSIDDRNYNLKQFKTDPEIAILVVTPASAKEGLTLTVANHAIYFDRTLSLDDYLQSQDRIHRYSQQKECHIYKLIMQDSVDIWVEKLLTSKQTAAKFAQRDIDAATFDREMSYEFGEIISEILSTGGTDNE